MPIVYDQNRITGEKTRVYSPATGAFYDESKRLYWGGWTANISEDAGEKLCALRRQYSAAHQEFTQLQKQCGKAGDCEGALFFKEEAAFARRRYNALLFIIPHFAAPDQITGDCRDLTEPWYWPLDLADDFDALLIGILN
ncbi:hypothetical protein [Xanthobacter sp. VNH20]|uniref:hypothetical protein n=1 Tax=Xanthobacter sp. VNH20 TaxID=3156616 RepID=UPI0032B4469A